MKFKYHEFLTRSASFCAILGKLSVTKCEISGLRALSSGGAQIRKMPLDGMQKAPFAL